MQSKALMLEPACLVSSHSILFNFLCRI